jgi:hypothetical protein
MPRNAVDPSTLTGAVREQIAQQSRGNYAAGTFAAGMIRGAEMAGFISTGTGNQLRRELAEAEKAVRHA